MLSLVGMTGLLFGIIEGPERGWTSPIVLATFVITAAVAVAFVRWERVAPHPMLPVSYFSDRRFSVGSATVTVSFFVMFGFFFLFSLYLQFARGYSPLDAGLATLPFAVAFVIVSPRSAALAERIGSGRTIAYGFATVGIGMVLMAHDRRRHAVSRPRHRDGPALRRHGHRCRTGDERDHERRADVEGRRRLGRQRHDA